MEKGTREELGLTGEGAKALVQTKASTSLQRVGMTGEGRAKMRRNLGF